MDNEMTRNIISLFVKKKIEKMYHVSKKKEKMYHVDYVK